MFTSRDVKLQQLIHHRKHNFSFILSAIRDNVNIIHASLSDLIIIHGTSRKVYTRILWNIHTTLLTLKAYRVKRSTLLSNSLTSVWEKKTARELMFKNCFDRARGYNQLTIHRRESWDLRCDSTISLLLLFLYISMWKESQGLYLLSLFTSINLFYYTMTETNRENN